MAFTCRWAISHNFYYQSSLQTALWCDARGQSSQYMVPTQICSIPAAYTKKDVASSLTDNLFLMHFILKQYTSKHFFSHKIKTGVKSK